LRRRRLRRRGSDDREGEGEGEGGEGAGPDVPDAGSGEPEGAEQPSDSAKSEEAGQADQADQATGADVEDEHAAGARQPTGRAGGAAKGIVEVLGNGSAFLRVDPPDPSDADVYISAAQVRRCELVSGDEVTGPVRTPRRSERYPSLVRVETINGAPADTVSDGAHYDELPVAWPSERIALGAGDPTLEAIEWLTPLGLGSRAVIVGPHGSGKTETLRRLLAALNGREGLELIVVLAGVRPEEIADWAQGAPAPLAALSFAASAEAQGQAVERAIDSAKRLAARGSNAVVLIDGLCGLGAGAARKALAAARNLREAGSLTVIATADAPIGGETTVIALDHALASTGRQPIIDLLASSTLRAELLVGEDGAQAIARARAAALENAAG
jgi:transcription termination factor Rho